MVSHEKNVIRNLAFNWRRTNLVVVAFAVGVFGLGKVRKLGMEAR